MKRTFIFDDDSYLVCTLEPDAVHVDFELQTPNRRVDAHGFVKWDGCGHVIMGEPQRYLHVCGHEGVDSFARKLRAVWNAADALLMESSGNSEIGLAPDAAPMRVLVGSIHDNA